MSKHTPGPWELNVGCGSKGYAGNYEIMAAIDVEHEANGRLIAAAPELLAACKRALPWLDADYPGHPVVVQVRKAIQKAEGCAQ